MLSDYWIWHIKACAKSFALMQGAVYYEIMNMSTTLCFLNMRKWNPDLLD
jgi:hypothetical protein